MSYVQYYYKLQIAKLEWQSAILNSQFAKHVFKKPWKGYQTWNIMEINMCICKKSHRYYIYKGLWNFWFLTIYSFNAHRSKGIKGLQLFSSLPKYNSYFPKYCNLQNSNKDGRLYKLGNKGPLESWQCATFWQFAKIQ